MKIPSKAPLIDLRILGKSAVAVKAQRALGSVLLFLLSSLLALGVAETVLRVKNSSMTNYDIEMWKYALQLKRRSSDPVLGHEHIPSASATLESVEIRLNERGLRGPPLQPQVANRRRILVLGSSMALGWGVREDETISGWLSQHFATDGRAVEVLNAGVGNYNAVRYVELFLNRLRDLAPSDILVLYFLRDAEQLDPGGGGFLLRHSELAVELKLALSQLLDRDRDLVSHYRAAYAPDAPGFAEMQTALAKLSEYAKGAHIRLYLATIPDLHNLDAYPFRGIHELMQGIATHLGYAFVDLLPAISGLKPAQSWVMAGDPHPSALGNRLMAEAIYPVLTH